MVRLDVNLLDNIAFACAKHPERAVDITQSFKLNQIKSKATVQKLIPSGPVNICVLGGWYGLGFMLTRTNNQSKYTCIDIDPVCEDIGNILAHRSFSFITADALSFDVSGFDLAINSSTEHMDKGKLTSWFQTVPAGTMCIFQNNNNFNVEDHINCFPTIGDFEDYICESFGILESVVDIMDNSTERYTVLCRKM